MRVLIACEFSGIVRDAFTAKGHDAMSCDLLPTEKPGKHYQGDVMDIINNGWDMMIAHPPCTYISNMSNCRIRESGRLQLRAVGMEFFMRLAKCGIDKLVLENPRGLPEREWRPADQIIQPYHYGHPQSKATCLWLKNVAALKPTEIVTPERKWDGKRWRTWVDTMGSHNAKNRSRTFQGVADAMAEQWGSL